MSGQEEGEVDAQSEYKRALERLASFGTNPEALPGNFRGMAVIDTYDFLMAEHEAKVDGEIPFDGPLTATIMAFLLTEERVRARETGVLGYHGMRRQLIHAIGDAEDEADSLELDENTSYRDVRVALKSGIDEMFERADKKIDSGQPTESD